MFQNRGLDDGVIERLIECHRPVAQARPAHEGPRRHLVQEEILDRVLVVALENPVPEIENSRPTVERARFMERWWWNVFNIWSEEGEHHFEVPAIKCVAGTIKRGLENSAANGNWEVANDPCDECSQTWNTDFNSVSQRALVYLHRSRC